MPVIETGTRYRPDDTLAIRRELARCLVASRYAGGDRTCVVALVSRTGLQWLECELPVPLAEGRRAVLAEISTCAAAAVASLLADYDGLPQLVRGWLAERLGDEDLDVLVPAAAMDWVRIRDRADDLDRSPYELLQLAAYDVAHDALRAARWKDAAIEDIQAALALTGAAAIRFGADKAEVEAV